MPLLRLKYIIALVFTISSTFAFATHLVGGSMDYEYVGESGGFLQYKVTLTLYRDCSVTTPFDASITLGIYNDDFNNSKHSNSIFTLLSTKKVDPPQGASCPGTVSVCIEQGIYSRTIDLPKSTQGFHLMFARCCRNNNQINIPDNNGQTYYAFIPPTSITTNNSPKFKGVPAPYICVNDTSTYLNSATDADGDSLSYKIVAPWEGGSSTNPIPAPPSFLSLPIPSVSYRPGFNGFIPFGNNGVAKIENNTGLTTMLATQQGLYSMAIEVTEWRNGVALSTIRRDVQIIAINCAGNSTPGIFPLTGGFNQSVEAGDTICFDIRATDSDNPAQNVKISAQGEVFGDDANWKGPKATFSTKTALGVVTSQFCWTPSCSQARPTPYTFVVDAIDDGCPPKSRSVSFSINVSNFPGQISFGGPAVVCENDTNKVYSTTDIPGYKLKWEAKGGTIVGSDSSSSVVVNWGSSGIGGVLLTQTNESGCSSPQYEYAVTIGGYPAAIKLPADTVCEFSGRLYEVTATAGSFYNWTVDGGTLASNPQPHKANVQWGAMGNGLVGLVETTQHGCIGDTNWMTVAITKPLADSIYGSKSVCPNKTGLEYIAYNGNYGSTYNWFVEGGSIADGNGNDTVVIDWGDVGTGKVRFVEITKWNCIGDTVSINIIKNHVLQGFKPVGEDSMCEFTNGIPYTVVKTNGSEYFWDTKGGTIVQDDTTNNVIIDWGKFGNAEVSVFEISYDSVNNIPCIGAPVVLDIVLHPIPDEDIIAGKYKVCEGDTGLKYTLNGFPGSIYDWKVNDDTINFTGQGSKTISLNITDTGKFTISVIETSQFGCIGDKTDSLIKITPKPKTAPITGDDIVCFPRFSPIQYFTSGLDSSTFKWLINSGTIDSGDGTNTIYTTFSGQPDNTIKVVETSIDGCLGDTIKYNVFADHPKLNINYVSVGTPDNYIVVDWELTDAPKYNRDFTIERRIESSETSVWKKVGRVDKAFEQFNDTNLYTDATPFQYRIKGIDLCSKNFYSDTHTNIVLKVIEPERFESKIDWTNYKGWKNGIRNYEVYRRNDDEFIYRLSRDVGIDTTDKYDDGLETFVQRFRVMAWENGASPDTSWSNEVELKFTPVLWVPNAFTPNNDGYNNQFVIVPGGIKEFEIEIFNRWGERVFASKNTAKSWDGTYKNQPCPDGVYMYKIRYTGGDNLIKIQKGNITLIR